MQDEYGLMVFHSRSHAVRASELLKRSGIPASIISTPAHLSVGCGVSVRVGSRDLGRASNIAQGNNSSTVAGIYLARQIDDRRFEYTAY